MGKVRDALLLLEWIHLITTVQILAEFSGTFTFGTYRNGHELVGLNPGQSIVRSSTCLAEDCAPGSTHLG